MAEKTVLTAESGRQEIVLTSIFDAPPAAVFAALTDPVRIPHWWGPAYLTTRVERMEAAPGGIWRIVQHDPAGGVHAFHGVYHCVEAPRLLVYTFEYEGTPEHIALETITLADLGGRTRMTDQTIFQSVEDRDGMLSAGMEAGAFETMQRLAALVEKR